MSGVVAESHRWRFFRAGGFDQVRLDRVEDLLFLDQLDLKLWVALSCPTRGLEFDQKTLDLIDTDKDGRIRAPEILAAVRWCCAMLKDPGILFNGSSSLALSAINEDHAEGARLLSSAKHILANLGKKGESSLSILDVSDATKIFPPSSFNGDGIIPAELSDDPKVKSVINDMINCLGAVPDRSGAPGVSEAKVEQFFKEAQEYSDWQAEAETNGAAILPLGDETAPAVAAYRTVKAKIDDFFCRCRLAAYDPRATAALNRAAEEYATLAQGTFSASGLEVAAFPLAMIEAGKPLPLAAGINPAWTAALNTFQEAVILPLLGEIESLNEKEWHELGSRLAAHEAWCARKIATSVEGLGLVRLREILADNSREAIATLIAADKAMAPEAEAIASVEKLLRFNRDLNTLLNNFINFSNFYSRRGKAIFQAGTLYLDGRSCDLCLKVTDAAKHGALAGLSRTHLAYCDCSHPSTNEKMTIVAAFTGGDADFLMAGRNGVFYDRQGLDWDATITKVVDNPISIRQAFWSPYKKIARFITEQIEKIAAAKEKSVEASATGSVTEVGKKVETGDAKGKAAPQAAFDLGKFVGIFAAIGLALGAIGSTIAATVTGFLNLNWWQMPLALIGVVLAVSGPSMVIAWLKLKQRNLGPLLDASGWAINARATINILFGSSLTAVAKLPKGADRALHDPYAPKSTTTRNLILTFILAMAAFFAYLYFNGYVK